MLDGIVRPTKKPDFDNIGKIICDALNKIAYDDDSQIVEANIYKVYADIPRVEVTLTEVVK
jgi:Holliday junction resolvase RusA-like endonuclease